MLKKRTIGHSLSPIQELEELKNSSSSFFSSKKNQYVIGLDEVGRGCLSGPVVVAGFCYPSDGVWSALEPTSRVTDSKKLSLKVREDSQAYLRSLSAAGARFEIVEIAPEKIDEVNILQATFLGMEKVLRALLESFSPQERQQSQYWVRIDGNASPKSFLKLSEQYKIETLVKGDSKSFAIAAASILAKSYRDSLMKTLHLEHPHYLWEKNVGYPTEDHRKAILEHGLTKWHRKSFCENFLA